MLVQGFRDSFDFLSNFYEATITYNDITYRNNEAAFQAQKDISRASEFCTLKGSDAKKLGYSVHLRPDWENVKDQIMYEICKAKFTQNNELHQKLVALKDDELIESNTWNDTYWGVCNGNGLNKLGFILMRLAQELAVFKVIIAGGRDFKNYELLKAKTDHILSEIKKSYKIVIVSGAANGADKLGEQYAKERGYAIESHPADWNRLGRKAGYVRNEEMSKSADACICFWDEQSRGTKSMIELAKKRNLLTRTIIYSNQ